jgi:peptidoglycan hydrolase CwlO-like protein
MLQTSPEMQADENAVQNQLNEPVSSLGAELRRISAEILSINANFQDQLQQAIDGTRSVIENHYQRRFEESTARIREEVRAEAAVEFEKQLQAELERHGGRARRITEEIARVTSELERVNAEIKAALEDPNSELSLVMRKRAEEVELQSYLHGLQFTLG